MMIAGGRGGGGCRWWLSLCEAGVGVWRYASLCWRRLLVDFTVLTGFYAFICAGCGG